MKENKEVFDKINKIIVENMKETMTKLILIYYHHYKTDNDSLRSIFNSLLELYILNEKDAEKLYKDLIKSLEDDYFYETSETMIKSVI